MWSLAKEMPLIGHLTTGAMRIFLSAWVSGRNRLKGSVVSELLEERQSSHSMVQYGIGEISRSKVWALWQTDVCMEIGT